MNISKALSNDLSMSVSTLMTTTPSSLHSQHLRAFKIFRPRVPIRTFVGHFSAVVVSNSSSSSSSSSREAAATRTTGVVIVGAGLAGLAAATRLSADGVPFLLVEASDAVGGRVRTDAFDGFLLDRGFQIFITAYPEAKKLLDYQALNLRGFYSGALVYFRGRFHTVADPLRHLRDSLLLSLPNPIGSLFDKLLILLARLLLLLPRSDAEDEDDDDESTTLQLLLRIGFSHSIIDRFFRPFLGGIFFDRELRTTSKLSLFIFKCLALGENALPANGISAIPEQLASKLPQDSILVDSKVVAIDFPDHGESSDPVTVRLRGGDTLRCELGVIVAVEQPEAERLLLPLFRERKATLGSSSKKPGRGTVCLYFSADSDLVPVRDPVLILNGSGEGVINNMIFATNVAPSYAPPGKALVSVSLIGAFDGVHDDHLTAQVVRELSGWFGPDIVRPWKHLRTYRIQYAQPDQSPPTDLSKDPRVGAGVYVCGDHRTSSTFDGALVSGTRAAEALLRERVRTRV